MGTGSSWGQAVFLKDLACGQRRLHGSPLILWVPPHGMRTRRIKAPSDAPSGLYHCISRVVDRRLVFGALEKERLCDLMRRYACFCGVRILTFCVMSNHFHLLIEVPRRPDQPPGDHELLERIAAIHSSGRTRVIRELFARATPEEREALRHRFWRRMGDLSQFLKELKQRFSQWHNLRQGRRGTLWEERFRSVLIGPEGRALSTVAAYIDLNPVRAGIVSHPAEYRWSGYAQAMAGKSDALAGYEHLMRLHDGCAALDTQQAFIRYHHGLFGHGGRCRTIPGNPRGHPPVRTVRDPARGASPTVSPTEAPAGIAGDPGGIVDRLLRRIAYFSSGAVIGTRGFVDSMVHRLGLRQPRTMGGSAFPGQPPDSAPPITPGCAIHPLGDSGEWWIFSLRASRT